MASATFYIPFSNNTGFHYLHYQSILAIKVYSHMGKKDKEIVKIWTAEVSLKDRTTTIVVNDMSPQDLAEFQRSFKEAEERYNKTLESTFVQNKKPRNDQ